MSWEVLIQKVFVYARKFIYFWKVFELENCFFFGCDVSEEYNNKCCVCFKTNLVNNIFRNSETQWFLLYSLQTLVTDRTSTCVGGCWLRWNKEFFAKKLTIFQKILKNLPLFFKTFCKYIISQIRIIGVQRVHKEESFNPTLILENNWIRRFFNTIILIII